MPEGYIGDSRGPEAEALWRADVRLQLQQLKNRNVPPVLGYATVNTIQAGIAAGGFVDITGLSKKVVVGDRRLIRVTTLVAVQQHTTKAAVQVSIDVDGGSIQSAIASVDGTTGDYATFFVIGVHISPAVGTHTYKVSGATGSSTFDANANTRGWLLIEDVGAAPA